MFAIVRHIVSIGLAVYLFYNDQIGLRVRLNM